MCRTRSAGRFAISASPSPTAATSAASTACRRRSSATSTGFCRGASSSRSRRSSASRASSSSSACGSCGSPAASRSCAATSSILIARLAALEDDLDVTLTTNAALLAQKAQALADAGLSRITVSLDSLDDEIFRAMNDVDFPVARVLSRESTRPRTPVFPVKVNVVVKRGLNEASILDIARRFRGTGHTVRFIEFMDVGATNGWRMDDVVPAAEIVATIGAEFPLEPVEARVPWRGRRALPVRRRRR